MRERGTTARIAVTALVLLAVAGGAVLWLDPFGDDGLTVHVRVVELSTGGPVVNLKVRGRHNDTWANVDKHGTAVLEGVALPPGVDATPATLARLIEVHGRFAVVAPKLPTARRRDEGVWDVEVPVESFGLLTISLQTTVLPNVQAYLETSETVRAVPAEGRSVARIGEAASYRVFPGPERVPVVVKGDMGVAMARWLVKTPAPGSHLQRSYAAIAPTPMVGRVVLGEGPSPPSLGGRLRIEPLAWRKLASSDALEVLGPLDAVAVSPDGSFLAPHTSPGSYALSLDLDFLGPVPVTDPVQLERDHPDVLLDANARTTWVRLTFPEGLGADRRKTAYTVVREPPSERNAWIVHHDDTTYAVLPERGTWTVQAALPGSNDSAPRIARGRVEARQSGGVELQLTPVSAPHGTLEILVPDGVRTTMRGATVMLDTGRTWSLLAKLTKRVEMKHVRAGKRTVTVAWRDKAFAPFVTTVNVPEGGTASVTVKREARAP